MVPRRGAARLHAVRAGPRRSGDPRAQAALFPAGLGVFEVAPARACAKRHRRGVAILRDELPRPGRLNKQSECAKVDLKPTTKHRSECRFSPPTGKGGKKPLSPGHRTTIERRKCWARATASPSAIARAPPSGTPSPRARASARNPPSPLPGEKCPHANFTPHWSTLGSTACYGVLRPSFSNNRSSRSDSQRGRTLALQAERRIEPRTCVPNL